jgi:hypothetical protein
MGKWRQYRPIEQGEFFLIGGDCSQGGADYNACQFFSQTNRDVPLVYHSRGVAAQMTRDVFPIIEKIFDVTGLKPMVAFETANGGASEMDTLNVMNKQAKYDLFTMPSIGRTEAPESKVLGYVTSGGTRPTLVLDLKDAIDHKVITVYDKITVKEFYSFTINEQGKPEAEKGAHDDLLIALAIDWQLYQICKPNVKIGYVAPANAIENRNWGLE